MEQNHYQYISDAQGQRTHVVLPIAEFEEMFEEVKTSNETLIVPEIATLTSPLITTKYVYWKDDGWFVGRFVEYPQVVTQGETLAELEENLLDVFELLSLEPHEAAGS
jgi:hypothetical protein